MGPPLRSAELDELAPGEKGAPHGFAESYLTTALLGQQDDVKAILAASLKNDRLTLRGVESRDGKEFLVVGSLLPPTVNIISHTQEIGFSELMRRLERVNSNKPETP